MIERGAREAPPLFRGHRLGRPTPGQRPHPQGLPSPEIPAGRGQGRGRGAYGADRLGEVGRALALSRQGVDGLSLPRLWRGRLRAGGPPSLRVELSHRPETGSAGQLALLRQGAWLSSKSKSSLRGRRSKVAFWRRTRPQRARFLLVLKPRSGIRNPRRRILRLTGPWLALCL